MENKSKTIKTRNTKNSISVSPLPAKVVAQLANCSESMVKKVRTGVRNEDTPTGSLVIQIDEMHKEVNNLFISEVKRIVKI